MITREAALETVKVKMGEVVETLRDPRRISKRNNLNLLTKMNLVLKIKAKLLKGIMPHKGILWALV